ncbi:MAG: HD domain-containing protein [Culicoidibacterales bacterium]
MNQLGEKKVFRDPIYTYITVESPLIWNLINTKEFQRLRRIRQLGGTFQTFHTADHTRFAHSLGVYELARRFAEQFNSELSEYDALLLQVTALLHDIGHGPFSHALEGAIDIHHEYFSIAIIQDENSEIHQVLKGVNSQLVEDIGLVMTKKYHNKVVVQMITSQLDLDRMDYILRDAYFSAVPYGQFDYTRLFRVMRIAEGQVVFKESGMHAIEDYMMSRYHMYWQVYYHPVGVSFEVVLEKWFLRLRELMETGYVFKNDVRLLKPLFESSMSVADYLRIDESVIMYFWQVFQDEDDEALIDLSKRLLNRRLFKEREISAEEADRIENTNQSPYIYKIETQESRSPYAYHLQTLKQEESPILLLRSDGSLADIAEISPIVKSIVAGEYKNVHRLFYNETLFKEE